MPEDFTGSGGSEDYLEQFNTAALLLVGFPHPMTTDHIMSFFGTEEMPCISTQRFRQPNKLTSTDYLMPSGRIVQRKWTY